MNVFVLTTGRSGSLTFAEACRHISNYSSGHETRVGLIGAERLAYPGRPHRGRQSPCLVPRAPRGGLRGRRVLRAPAARPGGDRSQHGAALEQAGRCAPTARASSGMSIPTPTDWSWRADLVDTLEANIRPLPARQVEYHDHRHRDGQDDVPAVLGPYRRRGRPRSSTGRVRRQAPRGHVAAHHTPSVGRSDSAAADSAGRGWRSWTQLEAAPARRRE